MIKQNNEIANESMVYSMEYAFMIFHWFSVVEEFDGLYLQVREHVGCRIICPKTPDEIPLFPWKETKKSNFSFGINQNTQLLTLIFISFRQLIIFCLL